MNAHAATRTTPALAYHAMPRIVYRAFLFTTLVALTGCGFHMQGASPLPKGTNAMYVSYHNNYRVGDPPVVAALKQRLRRQHLLGGTDAPAQLDIISVDNSQRIVSVSAVNGDAAEYALTTKVVFTYSVNGAEQLQGETLSTTRNYAVNDTRRLSAEEQREKLLTDMQQDLADLIFERIAQSNHKLAGHSDSES